MAAQIGARLPPATLYLTPDTDLHWTVNYQASGGGALAGQIEVTIGDGFTPLVLASTLVAGVAPFELDKAANLPELIGRRLLVVHIAPDGERTALARGTVAQA